MFPLIKNKTAVLTKKFLASLSILFFLFNLIIPVSFAQSIAGVNLPIPGEMVSMSPAFQPAIMKGITVNPDNPLLFDFLIDIGQSNLDDEAFKTESTKLIKYFLASLTVPEEELWVNLSPYEDDRIIPDMLGETEMGRDLLAQDYVLKQLTASLLFPENDLGSTFWSRVYEKTYAQFGTTDIPINTFNKIWIIPEKAVVYEHNNTAFIAESHLKVMLESDYVALNKSMGIEQFGLDSMPEADAQDVSSLATQVIKEIVIPEIEKEVNEGQNFANLRQIYQSMILSSWYKIALRESLLGQVYADQNKTKGIDLEDKQVKFKIYDQYLKAFNKGVYDYIKEDYDPMPQDVVYRKYISGGADFAQISSRVQRFDNREQLEPQQRIEFDRALLAEDNPEGSSIRNVLTGVAEISQNRSKDPKYAEYFYEEADRAVADQERVTSPSRNKGLFRNGGVTGIDERREIWGPESVDQAVLAYQRDNTPMTVFYPDQDNGTSSISPIYKTSVGLVRKQGLTTATTPIVTITIPSDRTKQFGIAVVEKININGIEQPAVVMEQFKGEKISDNPALPLLIARAITKGSPSEVDKILPKILGDTAEGRQEVRGFDPKKLNRIRTQITEPIDQAMRATFDLEDTSRVANPEKKLIRDTIGDELDKIGTNLAMDTRSPEGKRVRNLKAVPGGVPQEQDFGKAGDGVDRATIAVMKMPKGGVLNAGLAAKTLGILGQGADHVVYVPQSREIGKTVERDLQSSNLTPLVTVSQSTSVGETVERILIENSSRPGGKLGRPVGINIITIEPVKDNELTQSVNPSKSYGLHTVDNAKFIETAQDAIRLDEGKISPFQVFDGYSPFSTYEAGERMKLELSQKQRPTGPSFISKQTMAEIKSNPTILAQVTNLAGALNEVNAYQKINPNVVDFGPVETQVGQIKAYIGKRVDNSTLATKANDFYNTFSRDLDPSISSNTVKEIFTIAAGGYKPTAQPAIVPQNISYQTRSGEILEVPTQDVAKFYQDIRNLSPAALVSLGKSAEDGGNVPVSVAVEVYQRASGLITNGTVSKNTAAMLLHATSPIRKGVDKAQLSTSSVRHASINGRNDVSTPGSFDVKRIGIPKSGKKPVGGINLNPKLLDLQIKRDGDGIPLPLNQQPLNDMKIDGFLPFIIQITPVTNLQLLLGINPELIKETEISKAG